MSRISKFYTKHEEMLKIVLRIGVNAEVCYIENGNGSDFHRKSNSLAGENVHVYVKCCEFWENEMKLIGWLGVFSRKCRFS